MHRLLKIVGAAMGVILLIAGLTVWSLYRQATAAVPEYEAVLTLPPEQAEEDRQRLESQLTTLYSDTQALTEWQSAITAREINAWFATRLEEDFPKLLKNGLAQPRVLIDSEKITLAVRGKVGSSKGIVMVEVRPFATEGGEFGLEILAARVGRLALPLSRIVDQLQQMPFDEAIPVRFIRSSSAPTLIVNLSGIAPDDETLIRLTGIDLRDGELLIRGESQTLETETVNHDLAAKDNNEEEEEETANQRE